MAVATVPHMEIERISGGRRGVCGGNIRIICISPYPPSLRRMPARIMEPATGASTWALGSQRCIVYIGIFTRKAQMQADHQIGLVVGNWEGMRKEACLLKACVMQIARRRGSLAVMV